MNKAEDSSSNTIASIESFLQKLPGDGIVDNRRTLAYYRALLLCFNDRYGSQGILRTSSAFTPAEFTSAERRDEAFTLLKKIKHWNDQVRRRLAERTDAERVQMQRPLHGRSLLTLMRPRSMKHAKALNSLLVLLIDPAIGLIGYRHESEAQFKALPFRLPDKLQPILPKAGEEEITKEFGALNRIIQQIYQFREQCAGKTESQVQCLAAQCDVYAFCARLFLHHDDRFVHELQMPPVFTPDLSFVTVVPAARPGKDVILWKTWHTTCGSAEPDPKITAFVDLVPTAFLPPDLLQWYTYAITHSPFDPGAGTSRGSWLGFAYLASLNADPARPPLDTFGVSDKLLRQCERHNAAAAGFNIGEGAAATISHAQLELFDAQGYIVLPIPQELQDQCPADACLQNLSDFFKVVAEDPHFDMRDAGCVKRSETQRDAGAFWNKRQKTNDAAQGNGDDMWGKFHYYTRRISSADPFNPFATPADAPYCKLGQGGGKLISADSGLGPGSTFAVEPVHLEFQFSAFTHGIMQSFYQKRRETSAGDGAAVVVPLIPVLERFRVKTTGEWKKNMHVDICPRSLLVPGATALIGSVIR